MADVTANSNETIAIGVVVDADTADKRLASLEARVKRTAKSSTTAANEIGASGSKLGAGVGKGTTAAGAGLDNLGGKSSKFGRLFSEVSGQIGNDAMSKIGGQLPSALTSAAGGLEGLAGAAGPAGMAVAGVTAAIAAAAAIAMIGVGKFVEYANQVRDVRDASGLSADQSGRAIQVMDDYGVSVEQTAKGLGFLRKNLSANAEVLARVGITGKETADGTADMSVALEQAADAYNSISDPIEQAEVMSKALGKNWREMVPVLEQGGAALKSAMASADGRHTMSDEDLQKAREYETAMGDIKDEMDALWRMVGREVIPAFTGFLKLGVKIGDIIGDLGEKAENSGLGFLKMMSGLGAILEVGKWLNNTLTDGADIMDDAMSAASEWGAAQSAAAKDAADAQKEYAETLKSGLGMLTSLVDAQQGMTDARTAVADAEKGVTDAIAKQQSYASRQPAAMAKITSAQDALSKARKGERNAIKGVSEAQRELDELRKGEAATIEEARIAVEEAQNRINSSVLDQQGLREDLLNPDTATGENSVAQSDAALQARKSTLELAEARERLQVLETQGIAGTDEWKSAAERLAAAQESVTDAKSSTADAAQRVRDAEVAFATETVEANAAVIEAQDKVTEAKNKTFAAALTLTTQQETLNALLGEQPELIGAIEEKMKGLLALAPDAAGFVANAASVLQTSGATGVAAVKNKPREATAYGLWGQGAINRLGTVGGLYQQALAADDKKNAKNILEIAVGRTREDAKAAGYTKDERDSIVDEVRRFLEQNAANGT